MRKVETLTAYRCEFRYRQRNNPMIEQQREAIRKGIVPRYSFSAFIEKYKLYKSSINKSLHVVQRILSSSTRKAKVPVCASSKGCTIRRVEIPSNKLLTTAFEASLEC